MFAELPDALKQDVLFYLNQDNFPKAKALHDAWKDNKGYLLSSIDHSYSSLARDEL